MLRFKAIISLLFCLVLVPINGENIVRHLCNKQAVFYKVASNYSMIDASNMSQSTTDGPLGCVDLCIDLNVCKAFNFRRPKVGDAICELLTKDRTTHPNDLTSRDGWSFYDTGLFMSQVRFLSTIFMCIQTEGIGFLSRLFELLILPEEKP